MVHVCMRSRCSSQQVLHTCTSLTLFQWFNLYMEISIEVYHIKYMPGWKINLYSKCIDDVTRGWTILRASFEDESPLIKLCNMCTSPPTLPEKKIVYEGIFITTFYDLKAQTYYDNCRFWLSYRHNTIELRYRLTLYIHDI